MNVQENNLVPNYSFILIDLYKRKKIIAESNKICYYYYRIRQQQN